MLIEHCAEDRIGSAVSFFVPIKIIFWESSLMGHLSHKYSSQTCLTLEFLYYELLKLRGNLLV